MRMDESLPLMTPQEVADLLKISIKTVYKEKHRLGGVYPGGLRVLRFLPEVIHAAMAIPAREVAIPVRAYGEGLRGGGVQHQEGRPGRRRSPQERSTKEVVASAIEHGLLRGRR
jgi:hypothetical protein